MNIEQIKLRLTHVKTYENLLTLNSQASLTQIAALGQVNEEVGLFLDRLTLTVRDGAVYDTKRKI